MVLPRTHFGMKTERHGLRCMSSVNVDPDALQELKEAVFARHGRLYGRLREEATAALRGHARQMREASAES